MYEFEDNNEMKLHRNKTRLRNKSLGVKTQTLIITQINVILSEKKNPAELMYDSYEEKVQQALAGDSKVIAK